MENEKMSGQPTEPQNESDISKENKVVEPVKSTDQPAEQESDVTQLGSASEAQSESADEPAPEVSSEPEASSKNPPYPPIVKQRKVRKLFTKTFAKKQRNLFCNPIGLMYQMN